MRISKANFLTYFTIPLFLAWALVISAGFYWFGQDSYVRVHDSADGRLATRLALPIDLTIGEIGYWNPDLLLGVDRLAEGNSLELINMLFYILPGWTAYATFMVLQRFLAGYFTFRLLVDHLNVRPSLAIFPSFFFALFPMGHYNDQTTGFVVPNAFAIPGAPLLLWALYEVERRMPKLFLAKKILVGFAIGLLFAVTSNFAFAIFFFPLTIIWFYFVYEVDLRHLAFILSSFTLGWLVLEHQEILAAIFNAAESNRLNIEYCHSSLGTPSIWDQLNTSLFQSSLAIPAAIGILLTWPININTVYVRTIKLLGLAFAFIAFSIFLPRLFCAWTPVDLLEGFNFSRFSLYVPLIMVAGLSTGLENAFRRHEVGLVPHWIHKSAARLLLATFFVTLGYQTYNVISITFERREQGETYQNIFMNPYLERLAQVASHDPGERAAVIFHNPTNPPLHPAYLWPYGINTVDGYTVIYPQRFNIFWNQVLLPTRKRYPECRYLTKLAEGYSRLYLSTQCEVEPIEDQIELSDWFNIDLLSMTGTKYFVSPHPLLDPDLVEVDTSDIRCDFACSRYFLYENTRAFPFVSFFHEVINVSDDNQAMEIIGTSTLEQLKSRAVVTLATLAPNQIVKLLPGPSAASIAEYSADNIGLSISVENDQILMLNLAFSPYWEAYVNQQRVEIFPANGILMGVYLPQGTYNLSLRYQPPYAITNIVQ